MMKEVLIVVLGGGCGAAARYLVSIWAVERWGTAFPYGTLLVNLAGCLIIGMVASLTAERCVAPYARIFVMAGFLGGLTTFSSFSYETLQLIQSNHFMGALFNLVIHTLGGLIAAWVGLVLIKFI